MSTSRLACPICGEAPDVTRIDSGCVICNPVKWQAAHKPEVPVSTGPADRADGVGCLQHGIVGCERCLKLEFRHRVEIDPDWRENDDGSWSPVDSPRGGWLTLLVLAVSFLLVVGVCFAAVWNYWPR